MTSSVKFMFLKQPTVRFIFLEQLTEVFGIGNMIKSTTMMKTDKDKNKSRQYKKEVL